MGHRLFPATILGCAMVVALVYGMAWAQVPAGERTEAPGVTIFPTQERTITIHRNGSVVGTQNVPGDVGILIHADEGVVTPSGGCGQFEANGEIWVVPFPRPEAPRFPDRLSDAFANAPIVVSFRNSRVTIAGPCRLKHRTTEPR